MRDIRYMVSKPLLVVSCAFAFVLVPSFQSWKLKAASVGSVLLKKSLQGQANNRHDFQTTDFTSHVNQLLELVDLNGGCGARINLTVSEPFSVPTSIRCSENRPQRPNIVDESWCTLLKRIFLEQKQILPTNISISFSRADRMQLKHGYRCFESSSRNGEFCMTNFLEMERMKDNTTYPVVPWENRSTIPIWRGMPWMKQGDDVTTGDPSEIMQDAIARSPRLLVVAWSFDHPDLLDAKIGRLDRLGKHPYWKERETNGMDKLYPAASFIPPVDYYTKYQVALVLGGFGAAFRTSIHLSTETAIVLQEYRFKEWFTPMMRPFVHYVPLREDLTDLEEVMQWIADHPAKVRQIARNGHEFYNRYLSFEKNEAHIAELVYRMALMKWEREQNR